MALAKGGEFLICDMGKMPFPDGSASLVVSHQSHEHCDGYREGPAFLREAYRVLRTGGSLLVFVPDIEALAHRWLQYRDRVNREGSWGSEAKEGEINDYIYTTAMWGAFMGDEADRHRHGYTFDTLKRSLESVAPWQLVERFDWREIWGMDAAKDWWVLAVNACK